MKRAWTSIISVVFTGALAIGTGMIAGAASAEPADLMAGQHGVSDAILLAGADLNGKPPYKRGKAEKHEMEKGQFARFEEKPGDTEEGKKPMNSELRGKHPPFNRN